MDKRIQELRQLIQQKNKTVSSLEKEAKECEELLYNTLLDKYNKLEAYENKLKDQIGTMLDETENLFSEEEEKEVEYQNHKEVSESVEDKSHKSEDQSELTIYNNFNSFDNSEMEDKLEKTKLNDLESEEENTVIVQTHTEQFEDDNYNSNPSDIENSNSDRQYLSVRNNPPVVMKEDEDDFNIEDYNLTEDTVNKSSITNLYDSVDNIQHVLQDEEGNFYVLNKKNRKRYVQVYKDECGEQRLSYIDNG